MIFLAFKQNGTIGVFQNQGGKTRLAKRRLCIAIPGSVASDTPHLREKTSKVGLIGRAAATFRVDEIVIYPDNPSANQESDMDLIAALLSYIETPQYLRKRLFRLKPELQYVGVLPPLRTPHHPLNRKMKDLKIDEYREGVTLSKTGKGTLVEIGVEQPALLKNSQLALGKRITVKIVKVGKLTEVEFANRDEIPTYWGYTVTVEKNLFGKILKKRVFDLTIATSRCGVPLADVRKQISERLRRATTILVAFGSPTQGLNEIVRYEGFLLDEIVDFVVNTIPMQGTVTVRTEEALIASLAALKILTFVEAE